MSLVKVRVNSTTVTWRHFLYPLSHTQLFGCGLIRAWKQLSKGCAKASLSLTHFSEKNKKKIKLKKVTSLIKQTGLYRERHPWDRFALDVCSSETGKNSSKKKGKKVWACNKPSTPFLPQPPHTIVSSYPCPLPAPLFMIFFFSPCEQYRAGSHVAQVIP